MPEDSFDNDEISRLINLAFKREDESAPTALRKIFSQRLIQLDTTFNQARENLDISYRALNGILDATLEQVDFISLIKIAQFLELSSEAVMKLYADAILTKHRHTLSQSEKRTFILNNFDLPVLKSIGVIDSIRDFDHIEQRLKDVLELKSITDYNADDFEVALSSGVIVPKDLRSRKYFIRKARAVLKLINNPNSYSQDALIAYIPRIRLQSIDIENGLLTVMRSLYKLGVTVIFLPKMPALQMRGATFVVNEKPCIVLTDFRGYYPTLWFALMHEIFHVVFDWTEIVEKRYHLSVEDSDMEVVKLREEEANDFARDYMITNQKLKAVSNHISDKLFVREFALENHVHPSVIYGYYAYENSSKEDNYWQKFNRNKLFPALDELIKKLSGGCDNTSKAREYAAYYKLSIFNKD